MIHRTDPAAVNTGIRRPSVRPQDSVDTEDIPYQNTEGILTVRQALDGILNFTLPTSLADQVTITGTGIVGDTFVSIGGGAGNPSDFLLKEGDTMLGTLDMGTNPITNVSTINGFDIESHAARHLPNGVDALTTAAPTTALTHLTTNDEGGESSFARSDHTHEIDVNTINSVLDHGLLLGLSGDDHPQYLLADGSRTLTGNLNLGMNSILLNTTTLSASQIGATGDFTLSSTGNLLLNQNPSQPLGIATKQYVDSVVSGLQIKEAVVAKTATALPAYTATTTKILTADANGALPNIDGQTLQVGDRLLVDSMGTVSDIDNGIYEVTQLGDGSNPWILTRTQDADDDVEVTDGMFVFVVFGDVYATTGWILIKQEGMGPTREIGTDALTFTQFSGSQSFSFANENLTGVGVFSGLDGNQVNFRGIAPDSNKVTVADGGDGTIRIDIDETNIDHGTISGLDDDDHPQYLLVDGSRPMTGGLDMGGAQITNVGNVDGVNISGHSTRHIPGGADELLTAAPTTALSPSTPNGAGTGIRFSRNDHTHALNMSAINAALNHNNLTDLEVGDPHTQYLPLDASRSLTGELNVGGHKIIGVNDPTETTDAANANYVQTYNRETINTVYVGSGYDYPTIQAAIDAGEFDITLLETQQVSNIDFSPGVTNFYHIHIPPDVQLNRFPPLPSPEGPVEIPLFNITSNINVFVEIDGGGEIEYHNEPSYGPSTVSTNIIKVIGCRIPVLVATSAMNEYFINCRIHLDTDDCFLEANTHIFDCVVLPPHPLRIVGNRVSIERCKFITNSASHDSAPIITTSTSSNPTGVRICDNMISAQSGITYTRPVEIHFTGATDLVISGNHFENIEFDGVEATQSLNGLLFTGNHIRNDLTFSNTGILSAVFSGNYIRNDASIILTSMNRVNITGNYFDQLTLDVGSGAFNIYTGNITRLSPTVSDGFTISGAGNTHDINESGGIIPP